MPEQANMDEPKPQPSLSPAIIAGAIFLVIHLVFVIAGVPFEIEEDCAMYLRCGQFLLDSKIPYVDFFDINPPLVMYFNMIPAFISRITGLDLVLVFKVFVWLLEVLSFATVAKLLSSNKEHLDAPSFSPLIVSAPLFFLIAGFWGQLGQRDELFVAALFPYFVLRWLKSEGSKVSSIVAALIGLSLGFVLGLRPQDVPIIVCLEFFWMFRQRNIQSIFCIENIAAGVFLLGYGASLFTILPTPARESFFHRWMPMIVKGYNAYNHDPSSALYIPLWMGCFVMLAMGLICIRRRTSLRAPLLVWCGASFLSFAMQGKFWFAHCLPFLAGTLTLAMVQMRAVFEDWRSSPQNLPAGGASLFTHPTANCVTLIFCLALPSVSMRKEFCFREYKGEDRQIVLKETSANDPVMLLTYDLPDAGPPLLFLNRNVGSRYFFLFPLKMLVYRNKIASTDAERAELLQQQQALFSDLREDAGKYKPKLIFIAEPIRDYFADQKFLDTLVTGYEPIGSVRGRFNTLFAWKLSSNK